MTPSQIIKRPFFIPLVLLMVFLFVKDRFWGTQNTSHDLKKTHIYEGIIVENPEIKNEKIKHVVFITSIDGQKNIVKEKIILTTPLAQNDPLFLKNEIIKWEGKLKEPTSYKTPGVFDYKKYLFRKGITATFFAKDASLIQSLKKPKVTWWENENNKIKHKIKSCRGGPECPPTTESQSILHAILWGEESGITKDTTELFRKYGLSHLLVISGLHFVTLGYLAFVFFMSLFKLSSNLLLHFPCRRVSAGLTFIVLTLYYFFCETNPSITRSYIGASLFLFALVLEKQYDLLNILFLAGCVILVTDPSSLFDPSFQFSFLAVSSLFFIYPKFSEKFDFLKNNFDKKDKKSFIKRFGKNILQKIMALFLANLSITLGLTPFLIYHFHEISWNGLMMNLWAVPLVEAVIVPVGLVGLVVSLFSQVLSGFIFKVDLWLIDFFLYLLKNVFNFLPNPSLVFMPRWFEMVSYYGLILSFLLVVSKKIKLVLRTTCFLIFIGSVFFWVWNFYSDKFEITQIDVGQGDSILINLPSQKYILIDGGGSPYFDTGENTVLPFLLHQRIPYLSAVVATHADTDHYLGLISVLKRYRVHELWWNGFDKNDPLYAELFETAKKYGVKIRALKANDIILWEGSSITTLSPFHDHNSVTEWKDNNQSLVLQIASNKHTALFTGDIEKSKEEELVKIYGSKLKSDYLKTPHHGSKSSSSELFLKTVSPQRATLGAGVNNRFGHPHFSIIERYKNLGVKMYRTDIDGTVKIGFSKKIEEKIISP